MKALSLLLFLLSATAATATSHPQPDSAVRAVPAVAPIVVRVGTTAAANAALTEIFKASVHEMRPDRSGNHAWPSRHTSWAFAGASALSHELYLVSPWWVAAAHAVADATAMQRVLAKRHYPKDVIGGAAIGLMSAEIGYAVGRMLYPHAYPQLPHAVADWTPSLDITTQMFVPLCDAASGTSAETGAATSLRLTIPFADRWGAVGAATLRSMPVSVDGRFADMISSAGLAAGVAGWVPVGGRWAMEARAMAGVARNFDGNGISHPSCSFTFDIEGGISCRLTDGLAVGAETGYSYWALRHGLSAITLAIFSRVLF